MSNYPPVQPYAQPYANSPKPSGLAVASMICGIVSLVLFCIWHVAAPCAIAAIVLGIIAKKKINRGEADGNGMATAGIVCGSIALLLAVLIIAGLAALFFGLKSSSGQNWLHVQQQQLQYFQQMHPATAPATGP